MAQKFIYKILQDINDNPDKIEEIAGTDALVRIIFENAFNPANKWILPEGAPSFKKADEPDGMFPTNLYLEARSHSVYNGKQNVVLATNITFVRIDEQGDPIPISERVKTKFIDRLDT